MRWFITETFKFVDNPKWIFDELIDNVTEVN